MPPPPIALSSVLLDAKLDLVAHVQITGMALPKGRVVKEHVGGTGGAVDEAKVVAQPGDAALLDGTGGTTATTTAIAATSVTAASASTATTASSSVASVATRRRLRLLLLLLLAALPEQIAGRLLVGHGLVSRLVD